MELEFLNNVAELGGLGVLLALSVTANIFFYKEIKNIQERRVQDAKEVSENIKEPIKQMQTTLNILLNTITTNND